ncbi:MAG: hypothetical protein RMX96_17740 [Nostoc sp. ChiSLP02]|nr:hypothetical protein [Nostoc sp. DedSLP05]MDZ8186678.1 hypothetical protein [Nostoc sp. ChiSLP02]
MTISVQLSCCVVDTPTAVKLSLRSVYSIFHLFDPQFSVEALQLCIGANLSSNSCPTIVLPHPQPLPLARGGAVLRQQSRGGVTRILMVSE